ncbi:MAG: FprA family A-type flavoprotein [Lentisphaerae bacterium]|nr:FprA family A-type flavoprotein [Lentisphaerota bacterium]MCP4103246.1 FprA family A-type flavoprotein [Lentisphaerota bacterium]
MENYLKAVKLTDKVYWVGAIDWNMRYFHGYTTERGTTYNAYLVLDEKITLIDTVKKGFKDELMARISSIIDPSKIDYIISNHAEMDHSGCLPEIIDEVKPTKVYASKNGKKNLIDQLGELDIEVVRTGDSVNLGSNKFLFIECPMLHWPDSMLSYLDQEKVLFSQDAFGMHLAGTKIFADQYDPNVIEWESKKYFANILMPYAPRVLKLLDEIPELNLDIDLIASDHGPLWRKDINYILDMYREWSIMPPKKCALVFYDTMWGSTENMAKSIADGLRDAGIDTEVACLQQTERSNIITKIQDAGVIAVGSSTINNNYLPTMADVLSYAKGLKPKNKIGMAFGSYGWSGESIKNIEAELKAMKVELVEDNYVVKYVPTKEQLEDGYNRGVRLGKDLLERIAAFEAN